MTRAGRSPAGTRRLPTQTLLRAVYSLDASLDEWAGQVAGVLEKGFPAGEDFLCFAFGLDHPRRRAEANAATVLVGDAALRNLVCAVFHAGLDTASYPVLCRRAYTTISQSALWTPQADEIFGAAGVRDFVGLIATIGHAGVVLGTTQRQRVAQAPGSSRTWLGVARHIEAALRARTALNETAAPWSRACDAVFSPGGKVLDARRDARDPASIERLRRAVLARERARDWRRLDEPSAIAHWRDLVAGRWAIFDRFDSDGQRHVLAVRNHFEAAQPRRLTSREARAVELIAVGVPYKRVADQLDISTARAQQIVAGALAKLGVRDVAELVACAGSRMRTWIACWPLGEHTLAALRYPDPLVAAASHVTEAERRVATGLLAGLSYAQIAAHHGRSFRTIANQAAVIYRKFGVSGRLELIQRLSRCSPCGQADFSTL